MAEELAHRLFSSNHEAIKNGGRVVVPDAGTPEGQAYRALVERFLVPTTPEPAHKNTEPGIDMPTTETSILPAIPVEVPVTQKNPAMQPKAAELVPADPALVNTPKSAELPAPRPKTLAARPEPVATAPSTISPSTIPKSRMFKTLDELCSSIVKGEWEGNPSWTKGFRSSSPSSFHYRVERWMLQLDQDRGVWQEHTTELQDMVNQIEPFVQQVRQGSMSPAEISHLIEDVQKVKMRDFAPEDNPEAIVDLSSRPLVNLVHTYTDYKENIRFAELLGPVWSAQMQPMYLMSLDALGASLEDANKCFEAKLNSMIDLEDNHIGRPDLAERAAKLEAANARAIATPAGQTLAPAVETAAPPQGPRRNKGRRTVGRPVISRSELLAQRRLGGEMTTTATTTSLPLRPPPVASRPVAQRPGPSNATASAQTGGMLGMAGPERTNLRSEIVSKQAAKEDAASKKQRKKAEKGKGKDGD